ncbi:hypothetical protein OIU85_016796 [Salix viminalis]|uniref:Uncharacterized protein n=1 Tax=Salix viminalis TaxID=40686 RepID=A0A9Q0V6J8_SALVM|nr:hypothetical protein OIU85_016796 [Salix viminalis]
MDENVVALYEDEMKMKLEEDGIFLPFKKICKGRAEPFICFLYFSTLNSNVFQVEDLVIEDDNAAAGLLRYEQSGIDGFVLGSCSSNCISRLVPFELYHKQNLSPLLLLIQSPSPRELKGPGAPTTVLKCAPETFNVVGEEEREEWLLKDFLAKEAYGRQIAELN